LLEAAEQIVQERGIDALSVRTVAARVGTSTRAVYSLFGSKERFLVALGVRAFQLLGDGVSALPITNDPAADLVAAGACVFRPFAVEHPALFRIAMQHAAPSPERAGEVMGAATDALGILVGRVERLQEAGLLGSHTLASATCAFHALCEGLATAELRGGVPSADAEQVWIEALGTLVAGFALASPPAATRSTQTSRRRGARHAEVARVSGAAT
jgi:AcrR family transcriptional regulator